tara:strand:- start:62 stop:457 length:396 start_codon:yes stop_codon:yes gene_type:complete
MVEIPSIIIPPVETIETISIPLPTADVPSYVPLVVPPSDLREPEGTKPIRTTETPVTPTLNLPVLPPIPIPPTDVLITTSVAAVTAVAATTVTQPIIQKIKDKIQKFLNNKIKTWKEKFLNKQKKKDSSVN